MARCACCAPALRLGVGCSCWLGATPQYLKLGTDLSNEAIRVGHRRELEPVARVAPVPETKTTPYERRVGSSTTCTSAISSIHSSRRARGAPRTTETTGGTLLRKSRARSI